jgi:hypothetical protein
MTQELREQVAQQIEEAFAKTPRLKAVTVSVGSMWSSDTIDKAYLGVKWQDLPDDLLHRYSDSFSVFVPRAFRFFLPAYMRRIILDSQWGGTKGYALIFSLSPPNSEHTIVKDRFLKKTEAFTPSECAAILMFLDAFQKLYIDQDDWPDKHLQLVQEAMDSATLFWMMKQNGENIIL